jgi:hypothetical protein
MLTPEIGTRVPDRFEVGSYWLVCASFEQPDILSLQLIRPGEREPGPQMSWPVNRWRAFLDRHAADAEPGASTRNEEQ